MISNTARYVLALALGLASMTTASAELVVREVPQETFEDTVEVNLVNVEVYVTDKKGRPIRGLQASDFDVREDGRPMKLSLFSELREGREEAPSLLELPAAEATANDTRPYVILYVDNRHLRPAGRLRALEDMRSFLGDSVPWDRVMVLSQGLGVETVARFGDGETKVKEAFDTILQSVSYGGQNESERRSLFDTMKDEIEVNLGDGCERIPSHIRSYARSVTTRVSSTLTHLARQVSAQAGVPGRKNLIYIGDGLELVPSADVYMYAADLCPHKMLQFQSDASRNNLSSRFEQLTRHANANRVTFFALEAIGQRTGSSADAQYSSMKYRPSLQVDQIEVANLQSSLSFMADDTGGRAIFGTNRFADGLEKIADDLTSYYSLAYAAPHSGDDRIHDIDIKVPGKKKARLRYRRSYRDKPTDERMADRLLSALELGLGQNPLAAALSHGEITAGAKGTFLVPLRITMSLDKLVLLEQTGERQGRIRLQLSGRDEKGRVTAYHQTTFEVDLPDRESVGEHTFVINMEMRGGPHVLAVGIRDETGHATSYLTSRLNVELPAG